MFEVGSNIKLYVSFAGGSIFLKGKSIVPSSKY
jgi:hypothetical protein